MSALFTRYQATLKFRTAICGGIPKDSKAIEGWLTGKALDNSDKQRLLRENLVTFLVANGMTVEDDISLEDLAEAAKKFAGEKHTTGFRRLTDGSPYIEGRTIKAMLKEVINILYAGQRGAFGSNNPTKKGAKSFVAERIFVQEDVVPLNVTKDDVDIEMFITHTNGPAGPISGLNYVEMVYEPTVTFTVKALKDCIPGDDWASFWELAQENGLGAKRSQQFGRFDIVGWKRLPDEPFRLPNE